MTDPLKHRGMAEGVESLGRIRLQGFALLIIAFIVGLVAGGAIVRLHDDATSRRGFGPGRLAFLHRGPNGAVMLPPGFDQLGLTDDQRAKITAIFERHRPLTDSILRASLPHLQAITESTRVEVRAVLTPAQRQKMDAMFGRTHRLRRGFFGRPPIDAATGAPADTPSARTDSDSVKKP